MLHRADYQYTLFCLKNFKSSDKGVAVLGPGVADPATMLNVEYCLPQTRLHDYQPHESPREDFEEQVETHFQGYKDCLESFDVIITHDLCFTSWHLCQAAAIRKCAEIWPTKRWLHFCHSAPSGLPRSGQPCYPSSLRFSGCPNSTYVYLNSRQRQDIANHLQLKARDIAVVYNAVDPRDFYGFSSETCRMIDDWRLLEHQILQVYAFSTPRWKAKGVHKLLKIFGFWRRMGIQAKLVLVNAHANQEVDEHQVRLMEDYASHCGLNPGTDVFWTSRYAGEREREAGGEAWSGWQYSVPARVVKELLLISNLFVFPSDSECCSLVQAEASVAGKMTVLNKNCLQMLEFADTNCLAYEFANDPDRNPIFYECVARELYAEIQRDPSFLTATRARTQHANRDWIWKNQLEPLLSKGIL